MRLRKEQVDAMKGPDHRFRRELASLLAPAGGRADIDPDTGDLVIFQPSQPQTRVRFDDRGTPRELHGQDGRTLKFEYAPDGRAVSLVDRVGHRSTMTFDRQSRCNGVVNPLGDRRELVYENDRLVAVRRDAGPRCGWFMPRSRSHRSPCSTGAIDRSESRATRSSGSFA